MAYQGPYPVVFSGNTSAMVISGGNYSGDVINAGTIGAGGISLTGFAFLNGGGLGDVGVVSGGVNVDSSSKIVTTEVISGALGSGVAAIRIGGLGLGFRPSSNKFSIVGFAGGIRNQGLISAAATGIEALVSTFSGGISNGGTIAAGSVAVELLGASGTSGHFPVLGSGIFTGGISNSGRITAGGGSVGPLSSLEVWGQVACSAAASCSALRLSGGCDDEERLQRRFNGQARGTP